jgi:hypothetical protein
LQWVHVNFGQKCRLTGVATQGRHAIAQWVSSYQIEHGNDGHTWTVYRDPQYDTPKVLTVYVYAFMLVQYFIVRVPVLSRHL